MNQLKCDICNGTEFDKLDGFVCRNCGKKYTVDEARKKMLTEQDNGLVGLEKFLYQARLAKQNRDWESAEKYYSLAENEAPTNMEIAYYSKFSKAMCSLKDYSLENRKKIFVEFENVLKIIPQLYDFKDKNKSNDMLKKMSDAMIFLIGSSYVYNQVNNGGYITSDENETKGLFRTVHIGFIEILKSLNATEKQFCVYELLLTHYKICRERYTYIEQLRKVWNDAIKDTINEMKKLDPTYKPKEYTGGCYVATCVYGSYNCPQVWTLRRYRDYSLAKTWYGRLFIRTYYKISPTLVKWFGKTKWFKKLWRGKLDKMVKRLQAKGFENTPYDDIDW